MDAIDNNRSSNQSRILKKQKSFSHLSLSLHTMPQTADSHFKKWLFLASLIFGLMIIVVFLIFWQ